MVLHALIDTVKEEIVLTGTEEEVCNYMDFIIKVFGKNDLAKVNRFEVIAGDSDAVLNFFNFEHKSP